jgi:hypothetical protein
MIDCIALIGSTGFFEVFELAPASEQYCYSHFPTSTYHWSDGMEHGEGPILYIVYDQVLNANGMRITKDERLRDLVRTVERL